MTNLLAENFNGTNGDPWNTSNFVTEGTGSPGGAADIQNNEGRLLSGSNGGYNSADRTTRSANITAPTDVEVSGKFRRTSSEPYGSVSLRATTVGADVSDSYLMTIENAALSIIRLVNFGGAGTTTLHTSSTTPAQGTDYFYRFSAIGSSIKFRLWTGTEPGTWDLDTTDTQHAGAGKVVFSIGGGGTLGVAESVVFDSIVITDGAGDILVAPDTIRTVARVFVPFHSSAGKARDHFRTRFPASSLRVSANKNNTFSAVATNFFFGDSTQSASTTPAAIARAVVVPAPTVTATATTVQTAIARSVVVPAPTITATATTTPAAVTRAVVVPAPTVTATATVAPAVAAAVAAVPAAVVSLPTTASPGPVAGITALPSPAISLGMTVQPSPVAGTAAIPVPVISLSKTVTQTPVAGVAAVPVPTITASAATTPAVIARAAVINAPTVTTGSSATPTPAAVAGVANVVTPNITATATVTPSAISRAVVVPVPTVQTGAGALVVPAAVAGVASVPSPTVTNSANVAAQVVALAAGVPAPAISFPNTVTPGTIARSATVPAPSVSASGNATAQPSVVQGVASVPSASISAGSTVAPATVQGTASVPAATALSAMIVAAAVVNAAAGVPTPAVSSSASVTVIAQTVAAIARVFVPNFNYYMLDVDLLPKSRTFEVKAITNRKFKVYPTSRRNAVEV